MVMSKKPDKSKRADRLHIVAESKRDGKLRIGDQEHAEAMEFARRSFRKYASTYKALAK
jgi:hypothetical protein